MINEETGISLYIVMSVIAFKAIHAFIAIGPYLGFFSLRGQTPHTFKGVTHIQVLNQYSYPAFPCPPQCMALIKQ